MEENKKPGRPKKPYRFKCTYEQLIILKYMADGGSLVESGGNWSIGKRICHATVCKSMVGKGWIAPKRNMKDGGMKYIIVNEEAETYAGMQWLKNYPGI